MILTFKTVPLSVNKLYRGRRFSTKEGIAMKESLGYEAKKQWKEKPIEGQLGLRIEFHVKNKRADLDNLLKGFLDSLSGILYLDDSQIVEIKARRYLAKEPQILLEVYTNI